MKHIYSSQINLHRNCIVLSNFKGSYDIPRQNFYLYLSKFLKKTKNFCIMIKVPRITDQENKQQRLYIYSILTFCHNSNLILLHVIIRNKKNKTCFQSQLNHLHITMLVVLQTWLISRSFTQLTSHWYLSKTKCNWHIYSVYYTLHCRLLCDKDKIFAVICFLSPWNYYCRINWSVSL